MLSIKYKPSLTILSIKTLTPSKRFTGFLEINNCPENKFDNLFSCASILGLKWYFCIHSHLFYCMYLSNIQELFFGKETIHKVKFIFFLTRADFKFLKSALFPLWTDPVCMNQIDMEAIRKVWYLGTPSGTPAGFGPPLCATSYSALSSSALHWKWMTCWSYIAT